MVYIERDSAGRLLRVAYSPFEGMQDTLSNDDPEVIAWQSTQTLESGLAILRQSDLDMIRVLEDLIYTLIAKGTLRITDLPPAAQEKLISRSKVRDTLGAGHRLISDEDDSGLL